VPAFSGDEQVALRKIVAGELLDPREIRPDFPSGLWKVLAQTLSPKPEARPRQAAQLARSLDTAAGLTQAQGRALLSSAIRRLFPDEMGAESSDIAELRRLSRAPDEATAQGHVVSRVSHDAPRRRSSAIAWAAGLGVAVGAAALFATRGQPPPAEPKRPITASAAALSASVEVSVQVSPAALPGLSITIGGEPAPADAPQRSLPRGAMAVPVEVQAPGYRPVALSVVPDRDQSLVVNLAPLPPAAPPKPSATPARPPAAAPTGVIRRYPF
jgi:hypothetical protein